jgi:preprotein translocase subunit SecG
MSIVLKLILITQMLSAIAMIGLILVQHGKGADMGAAFGSGGSGSLFGASGSANFMSRATSGLAAVFFVCTMALSYFGNLRPTSSGSVLDSAAVVAPVPTASTAPAAPASPAAQIPDNKSVAPASPVATTVVPVDASKPATQIPTK